MKNLDISYICNKNGFVFIDETASAIIIRHIDKNIIDVYSKCFMPSLQDLDYRLSNLNMIYNSR